MPNREYEKGRRAEWELRDMARAVGLEAQRSAASRGPFDLAISNGHTRWLVDIKCDKWAGPQSRARLVTFADASTICVLACRLPRKKWLFRLVDEQGDMGPISTLMPWSTAV